MERPPLRDVARLAGVSEPTVSRVLNGRDGVAVETRRRVVQALRELGFEDIPAPQSQRQPQHRRVVGIVCGDFLNPVFGSFIHHISTALARTSHLATVAVTDSSPGSESRCVDELTHAGVDAIVFIGGVHAEIEGEVRDGLDHYRALAARGTPFVLVNGRSTGLPAPHVVCDEQAAARRSVELLARLGHTQIGCVLGSPRFIPTLRFERGFRAALKALDLAEPADAVVHVPFTFEGGRAGAARLIEQGITAVICGNDLMALGALLAARARPSAAADFSVIGYDGTDFTGFTDPPLTTHRQPFEDMAQLIADAAIAEISGSTRFRDRYLFEADLLLRESTHALRAVTAARPLTTRHGPGAA